MDNIGDILSSLSEKDIESLKQTAQSLFGDIQEKKEEENNFGFQGIDPAVIGKISKVMARMNSSTQNPRCELIKALKPLLKDDRKHKADQLLNMMKMFEILPIIEDLK
ncbi:MAG: hypothetical protein IJ279_02015 [Clostridia bacterium]|nr:hypothetical protein [Clostridia bacterium]